MNQLVVELYNLQNKLAQVDNEFEEKYADWVREHIDLITAQEDLKSKIQTKREEIKTAAVEHYTTTGDKKPHPAVSIKEYTRYRYDADAALEWAETHVPILVERKLNIKSYERFLKEQKYDMPGEIYLEPVPQISSDLSKYLTS